MEPLRALARRARGDHQVLLVQTAALSRDPAGTMNRVFEFIGVDPFTPPSLDYQNVGGYAQPLDPHLRRLLNEWFAPHASAMAALEQRTPTSSSPEMGCASTAGTSLVSN